MTAAVDEVVAPKILRLTIQRFRGIKELTWYPGPGVNVILGGGDVGKSTILEAIALLFSPVNTSVLADTDYYQRDIGVEFVIEAVAELPASTRISDQTKHSWPWGWDGKEVFVPGIEDDAAKATKPVYRLRVRGTEDFDLTYEIVQPDGSVDTLSVALRRAIGLVRLAGDDRNDRDLRLVHGSGLSRLLADKGLRSRLAAELSKDEIKDELGPDAQKSLKELDVAFKKERLPSDLELAYVGGQSVSIASLVGLTAKQGEVQLPLGSWGSGTRRLASLMIAEQNQTECPITIVDEVERGLEPYRQRTLMTRLQSSPSQAFVTTHSPSAVETATDAKLWYVDASHAIGGLEGDALGRLRRHDPLALLSRLTIVAEGITEVGFVSTLLQRALSGQLEQYGVHVSDGTGHDETLGILEALTVGGLKFGGFADNEGKHPERWGRIEARVGPLMFRWKTHCVEPALLDLVGDEQLELFISDPDGEQTGYRLRTLADRLGITDKDFASVRAKAGESLRTVILGAALGAVPAGKESEKKQYASHAHNWFKRQGGGKELATKMFTMGMWPHLKEELMPFCNAVRQAIDLDAIEDVRLG